MPFYTWLRPEGGDTPGTLDEKRRTAVKLRELRQALRDHLSEGSDALARERLHSSRFLRLATWNIREFDNPAKFGTRSMESLYYIAEILSHFDLIAVQEVREDLYRLKQVMSILGSRSWDYIATDVTEGSGGNDERMVFVYNKDRVTFTNLAGEVTLPDELAYPLNDRVRFSQGLQVQLPAGATLKMPKVELGRTGKLRAEASVKLPEDTRVVLPKGSELIFPEGLKVDVDDDDRLVLPSGRNLTLDKKILVEPPRSAVVRDSLQFKRTPFIVSFQSGWLKVNICTVHIYFGTGNSGLEKRRQEIKNLTKFLAARAESESDSDANSYFCAIGDFNIISKKHETMQALEANGFKVPQALHEIPLGSNVKRDKAYDQMAFYYGPEDRPIRPKSYTSLDVRRAGIFDFFNTVYKEEEEPIYKAKLKPTWKYKEWRTYQMSDHLPMWVELQTDFGDNYLSEMASNDN